jgi:biotin carboxylase
LGLPSARGAVVSWSVPNERTLEDLSLAGTDAVAVPGPLSAVYALADKRAAKSLFCRFGIPTPNGVVLDRGFIAGGLVGPSFRDRLEGRLSEGLRYPLIVKPLWDCLGHGASIANSAVDLRQALGDCPVRDLLVEEFIEGHSGSLEIVGEPGDYFFRPVCWTGSGAGGVGGAFEAIRVAHRGLFTGELSAHLLDALTRLLGVLGFRGACCVDFVISDGKVYALEINPRVSGVSCLSAAASGVNSFEAVYRVAKGQWAGCTFTGGDGAAVQAGGAWADKLEHAVHQLNDHVDLYRDTTITVDGFESRSIIVGGSPESIEALLEALRIVAPWGTCRGVRVATMRRG